MHLNVTLFFTFDVSLKEWAEKGLLDREVTFYTELSKKNISVQFLTYGDYSDFQYSSKLGAIKILPIYEKIPRPKSKLLRIIQSFLIPFYFRDELVNTHVYKTNQMWGSWVTIVAKLIYRKPVLLRCGYELFMNSKYEDLSFFKSVFLKVISWISYYQSDHIWLNSNEMKKFVTQVFSINTRKITVCPNWIDSDLFSPKNEDKYKDRILFIGRFSDEKNIDLLINALSGLDVSLDLVGHGNLIEKYKNTASKCKVRVNFLGSLPNQKLPKVYNKYSIFVLPSKYEGNPKALLEAMSCGCAVIGTDVQGIRNIIVDGVNGLLVPEDSKSLKAAIIRLRDEPLLRHELGKEARLNIFEQNSLFAALQNELFIYRNLCFS